MHIPFGIMVKFEFFAQFLVDHIFEIMQHYVNNDHYYIEIDT